MAHIGDQMIIVKGFEMIQLIKIDEDMSPLRGRYFNARNAEDVAVLGNFNGAADFIVVGYRNADIQFAYFLGNRLN